MVLVVLLENKPVLLGSGGRGRRSRGGLDISSLVLGYGVGADLVARSSRLGWQLECLHGAGVSGNGSRLELLDLLDVQVRDQVVASGSRSEQSSG